MPTHSITTLPALPAELSPTSGGDVFTAIMSLWLENASVGNALLSIFNGIFRDRLPPTVNPTDIGHPYVVILTPTNRRTGRTTFSEFWEHIVTFKVYDTSHELAEQRIGIIGEVFDDAEADLNFYLQPEGETQSSQSAQSVSGSLSSQSAGQGKGTDDTPPAGEIISCDRITEGFGEEDRAVRFAAITYRIVREKRRRLPATGAAVKGLF